MSNLNCFPLCYICLQISEGSRISRYQLLGHKYERKIFLRKTCILLSISLLWLPCMFLFSLKFRSLQRLLLDETMDVSSWNVDRILKTAWKWSSWSLIWEQDDKNVSLYFRYLHALFVFCNSSYCFADVAVAVLVIDIHYKPDICSSRQHNIIIYTIIKEIKHASACYVEI